jgi:hypothetical protein
VPVPQPVMDDPGGYGLVVVFLQVGEDIRAEGGAAAGAGLPNEAVSVAQERDHVLRPGLEAAGAEFRDGPAAADDVRAALLDAGQPGQEVLVAGIAVGDEGARERAGQRPGDRVLPPRADGLQEREPAVGRADDHGGVPNLPDTSSTTNRYVHVVNRLSPRKLCRLRVPAAQFADGDSDKQAVQPGEARLAYRARAVEGADPFGRRVIRRRRRIPARIRRGSLSAGLVSEPDEVTVTQGE